MNEPTKLSAEKAVFAGSGTVETKAHEEARHA
jgi:hypothetical protein